MLNKSAREPKVLVISQYPLAREVLAQANKVIDSKLEAIVVSSIGISSYIELLRYFYNQSADKIYLYTRTGLLGSVGSILLLAILSRPSSIFIFDEYIKIKRIRFWEVLLVIGSISTAYIKKLFEFPIYQIRLRHLLRSKRIVLDFNRMNSDADTILYLKTNLWMGLNAGGSISHVEGVINAFIEKKYKVHFSSAEENHFFENSDSLKYTRIPSGIFLAPREINYIKINKDLIIKNIDSIKKYKFIYHRYSLIDLTAVELSRALRLPLILEFNGFETWIAENWGKPLVFKKMAEKAEVAVLKHAHLITVVSRELEKQLIARGVSSDRIIFLPNAADVNAVSPELYSSNDIVETRRVYEIPTDSIVVSFVGTFGVWHGGEVFAEAVRQLCNEHAEWVKTNKFHAVFVGDGVRKNNVATILSGAESSCHVSLLGLVDRSSIPAILAASDIFVAPNVPNADGSAFFGSPTKLFEYMAAGRPILGSRLNQIADILEGCLSVEELERSGKSNKPEGFGILLEPGNAADLVRALRYAVPNREWRLITGANARKRSLERHSWSATVSKLLLAFDNAANLDRHSNRPVHVLINSLHSRSGGGVTYIRNLVPNLIRNQKLSIHIVLHEEQRYLFEGHIDDAHLHYVNFSGGFASRLIFEQFVMPKIAQRIDADVVFSPANYGPLFVQKSVVMMRNAMSVAFVEKRFTKIVYWLLLYAGSFASAIRATRIIAVSKYAIGSSGITLPARSLSAKTVLVRHGVSRLFRADVAQERLDNSVLAVADLYVQKNLHNLLVALKKVITERPTVSLKIAGSPVDRDYAERLHKLVIELSIEQNVEFLGKVETNYLLPLYQSSTIFVFPSTIETFGNPLVEAMVCGCPVACSNTAAMPEVAGDAAAYFDPYDVDDMARVILELLESPERREALSKKATERSKMYSWEETARKTADVLIEAARS